MIKGAWQVYADGSGTHHADSPACVGVVIADPSGRIVVESSSFICTGTNNVAELWALRRALYLLRWASPDREHTVAEVCSDSEYALGIARGEYRAKKNVDLCAELGAQAQRHAGFVVWKHVPGHAGVPGNELADWLAGLARQRWMLAQGRPTKPVKKRPFEGDRLWLEGPA